MLNMANFKDDSSPNGTLNFHSYPFRPSLIEKERFYRILTSALIFCSAWDYSIWVRTYALFLEERLECIRVLKYDVETEYSVHLSLSISFSM